jgi:hypothetical protein
MVIISNNISILFYDWQTKKNGNYTFFLTLMESKVWLSSKLKSQTNTAKWPKRNKRIEHLSLLRSKVFINTKINRRKRIKNTNSSRAMNINNIKRKHMSKNMHTNNKQWVIAEEMAAKRRKEMAADRNINALSVP